MGTSSNLLFGSWLYCLAIAPAAAEGAPAAVTGDATAPAVARLANADAPDNSKESAQAPDLASSPAHASDWKFSAAPYLWMAGLKGDMGVVEQVEPVGVDLSFIDILGALKFALMGTVEARKGRFVATADMIYLSMGADKNIDIREVDFLDVELDTKTFITTATAGYRAIDRDRLFLDLFAGGRINSMKTSLDLVGPQRSFSGSKTETWVDPIIGTRLQAPLGEKWSLQAYGDIGGFGVGSHLTWQVSGVVHYQLSNRWSLSGGWRHLKTDYDDNGFVFDAAMDGPILGAVYRF